MRRVRPPSAERLNAKDQVAPSGTIGGCALVPCRVGSALVLVQGPAPQTSSKRITWDDVAPVRAMLEARGIPGIYLGPEIDRIREEHARRVREGDLDHLVFYLLQSTRFTKLPPIEPALSAKSLADSLDAQERAIFLREARVVPVPHSCRRAIADGGVPSSHRVSGRRCPALVLPRSRSVRVSHDARPAGRAAARVPACDAVRLRKGVRGPAVVAASRRGHRALSHPWAQHRHRRRGRVSGVHRPGHCEVARSVTTRPSRAHRGTRTRSRTANVPAGRRDRRRAISPGRSSTH